MKQKAFNRTISSFPDFSDSKQDDDRLFEEICGSWADDGLTAEEEIKELQTARRQDTTRNIINL